MALIEVPLEQAAWSWPRGQVTRANLDGRDCILFGDEANGIAAPRGVRLRDGTVELDLAVSAARAFHGIVWRRQSRSHTYESFFVRPHQVGNPDAVQYTPVFNDVSAWQLYHGPGYWAPVSFPIGRWFTLHVAFAGSRGEAYVDDLDRPALVFAGLKAPQHGGGIGILAGGPGLHVARFAYDPSPPTLLGRAPRITHPKGIVPGWWVSDPFAEVSIEAALEGREARSWTFLPTEPTGLANLARVSAIVGRRNTVLARTSVRAADAGMRLLRFGFSDRTVVYLNGRRLFSGNDTYRSRDYRFLGSIGYWYTLDLPLRAGDNELVFAVSESFGGWGLQARLDDPASLSFETG